MIYSRGFISRCVYGLAWNVDVGNGECSTYLILGTMGINPKVAEVRAGFYILLLELDLLSWRKYITRQGRKGEGFSSDNLHPGDSLYTYLGNCFNTIRQRRHPQISGRSFECNRAHLFECRAYAKGQAIPTCRMRLASTDPQSWNQPGCAVYYNSNCV